MTAPSPTPDTATPPAWLGPTPERMRAARQHRYGTSSDVIDVAEVDTPTPEPGTVLVEVRAAALNPLDLHMMTGTPWLIRLGKGLRRPNRTGVGVDVAGRVVAVGEGVAGLAIGDEVMGVTTGACAQYALAEPDHIVPKPAGVTFAEAAGMGVAGVTALQGLRDHAALESGQRVLVNGASGGVGLAAVQIASWIGAEVTAVCSTRNVELVRSAGADHVIDYTSEDFTTTDRRYDVMFDNQGNRPLRACQRLLTDDGLYLLVGGPKKNRAFGPVLRMVRALVLFRFTSGRARAFVADERADDLAALAELMASGDLRTVVDTTYELDRIRDAMDHLADGHARGKILVTP